MTDNATLPNRGAIVSVRGSVVDARFDPVAWLGRKILRRPDPMPAEVAASYAPEARSGEVIDSGARGAAPGA